MSDTALDLDLATLVGELPAVPCEAGSHMSPIHASTHGGPATHYARVTCEYCHMNKIKAYCGPFVAHVIRPDTLTVCECGAVAGTSGTITILGPVHG